MLKSFAFWLIVLAALLVYLCFSVGRRWRAEAAKERLRASQWRAKAFDVSAIARQIRRVHENPLAVVQARPHFVFFRQAWIGMVRRTITRLSFFHSEREPGETRHAWPAADANKKMP